MNKYKILVFDLDDTLIDNFENIKSAFQAMVENENESYEEKNFLKWYEIDKKFWKDWQDGLVEIPSHLKNETGKKSDEFLNWVRAQRVLIYFSDKQMSLTRAIELNNIYMNALTQNVIAIEGAKETLEYLKEKYDIIVATNGPKIAAKEKVNKIGCLEFVKEVLSAENWGVMKPHKAFFEGLQTTLNNFNKNEYLIIGDSLKSDVGLAINCDIDSCWFNRNKEVLNTEYAPTMEIQKLKELIKKL